jgi:hypothetical protein
MSIIEKVLDNLKVQYYRYTVMTGVYMLGPAETYILHAAYIIGLFLLVRYTYAFLDQLIYYQK